MNERSKMNRRELLGASIVLPLAAMPTTARSATPSCGPTPPQTTGPFHPVYEQVDKDVDLTRLVGHEEAASGLVIRVHGQVARRGLQAGRGSPRRSVAGRRQRPRVVISPTWAGPQELPAFQFDLPVQRG